MEVAQSVSKKTAVGVSTVLDIIAARQNPIRSILKRNQAKELKFLEASILDILEAVTTMYTSVDYSKLSLESKEMVLKELMNAIFEDFPILGVWEIKKAFRLAAVGKIKADLRAFQGRFTVPMLGGILRAYIEYSNRVISEYKELEKIQNSRLSKMEQIEKNKQARRGVVDSFLKMKETYNQDMTIDEGLIKEFWGKILVEEGLITFSREAKKQIYQEAKELVKQDISREMAESENSFKRRELKQLLDMATSRLSFQDEKLTDRARVKYAKLIVKKSIINS